MNKEQIKRIEKMETALDRSASAVKALSDAVDMYEACQDDLYALIEYYSSTTWMNDFEDDEAGKIPADVKRGVLSEDAVYDLLTEHRELMVRLQQAVLRSLEES